MPWVNENAMKRDYENNEINEKSHQFPLFRHFRFFRNLSSSLTSNLFSYELLGWGILQTEAAD